MSSHIHISIRKSDQGPVTFPTNIITQGTLPHVIPTDGPPEGLQMGESSTHLHGEFYGPQCWCCSVDQATIDKLTDDSLLDIFDFYLKENQDVDEWHTLVHVCRRWRNIVFASPLRLDLRLLCTKYRPVRATLDTWPVVLPLVIEYHQIYMWELLQDNVIAALEHHDRVRQISLGPVPNLVWEPLASAMQVPFPELTFLSLWSEESRYVPVLPDSFLGGSAPRLQSLSLGRILFPTVQNLLLSTSGLVDLDLRCLPHSGYISPASMVGCLSSLNRLKLLSLGFQSPLSRPHQLNPPPQTRVVLPALSSFTFEGMVDYSEDFLTRIDTPVLNQLYIVLFMDLVFDIPHFKQFAGRAKGLNQSEAARLVFTSKSIRLESEQPPGLSLGIRCNRIDWQLDSISLVCGQLSPFFSSIERFELIWRSILPEPKEKDDIEYTQFLEIVQSFTAIQSLYVSKTLVPFISPALQELIGDSAVEVLPNLRDLPLEGFTTSRSTQQDIQPFIEARRLAGQPVAVHHWGDGEY